MGRARRESRGTHQEASERGGFARGGRFGGVVVVVEDARGRLARHGWVARLRKSRSGRWGGDGWLRGARVRFRNARGGRTGVSSGARSTRHVNPGERSGSSIASSRSGVAIAPLRLGRRADGCAEDRVRENRFPSEKDGARDISLDPRFIGRTRVDAEP